MGIGDWLGKYGEAIYETRPWLVLGEGPTRLKKGGGFTHQHSGYLQYTPEDIRFTRKGNTVYAIVLGWPGENSAVTISSFGKEAVAGDLKVTGVSMLGCDARIKWRQTSDGLMVTTPDRKIHDMGVVFRIETE